MASHEDHQRAHEEALASASSSGTFDLRAFDRMIGAHGHGGFLGMRFHDQGEDWVELALDWREELVGEPETGVLASGPIVSLMDNVTSLSVWRVLQGFRPQVTLDLRIDYMRAAEPGRTVIGRGECYKVTRNIAFVRGVAHHGDLGDPIAHVAGTFIAVENLLA